MGQKSVEKRDPRLGKAPPAGRRAVHVRPAGPRQLLALPEAPDTQSRPRQRAQYLTYSVHPLVALAGPLDGRAVGVGAGRVPMPGPLTAQVVVAQQQLGSL